MQNKVALVYLPLGLLFALGVALVYFMSAHSVSASIPSSCSEILVIGEDGQGNAKLESGCRGGANGPVMAVQCGTHKPTTPCSANQTTCKQFGSGACEYACVGGSWDEGTSCANRICDANGRRCG